jgi:nucleotide-binding universal stress UspA family protein
LLDSRYGVGPRKVLLASGIGESDLALRVGSRWARDLGADVAACHVFGADPQVLANDAERIATALRDTVTSPGRGARSFEVLIAAGEPRRTIIEAAEGCRADLLVVGAPPRALGGISTGVLESAHCSVLVARRSYAEGPIVVGYDFSDTALTAVWSTRRLARACGARVVVLHSIGSVAERESAPALAERIEAARHAVSAAVGAGVEVCVASARPDFAMLAAERELGARLLVVGACGSSTSPRRSIGSVAAGVATAATGPVLLCRAARALAA